MGHQAEKTYFIGFIVWNKWFNYYICCPHIQGRPFIGVLWKTLAILAEHGLGFFILAPQPTLPRGIFLSMSLDMFFSAFPDRILHFSRWIFSLNSTPFIYRLIENLDRSNVHYPLYWEIDIKSVRYCNQQMIPVHPELFVLFLKHVTVQQSCVQYRRVT